MNFGVELRGEGEVLDWSRTIVDEDKSNNRMKCTGARLVVTLVVLVSGGRYQHFSIYLMDGVVVARQYEWISPYTGHV